MIFILRGNSGIKVGVASCPFASKSDRFRLHRKVTDFHFHRKPGTQSRSLCGLSVLTHAAFQLQLDQFLCLDGEFHR